MWLIIVQYATLIFVIISIVSELSSRIGSLNTLTFVAVKVHAFDTICVVMMLQTTKFEELSNHYVVLFAFIQWALSVVFSFLSEVPQSTLSIGKQKHMFKLTKVK